ncbi:MAG: SCO family protein [Limisphaerales bacterium]
MTPNLLKQISLLYPLLFACPALAMPGGNSNAILHYQAAGTVERIAAGRRQATIDTDAIPGYMMKMTMDYPVLNTNEIHGLSPGDRISFTLVVSRTNDWIEDVHCLGHSSATNQMPAQADASAGTMGEELKTGDQLPNGTLLAEDGHRIQFSTFRGDAVAFTFFYTRCPLPNYCPLMNRNFAAARDLILSMPNAPTNWEFLSISFDPQNDTPQTLVNYAELFRGEKTNHWLFASAPTNTLATLAVALDLMVIREGSSISHNLRTVVLDPRGRIYRELDGNEWTPRELADAVVRAARQ